LSSAVTAYPFWEDRFLGTNEIGRVPVRCVWIASGNNVGVSTEMARRIVRIRLDPKQDRPWLRDGFKYSLRTWVPENRSRLVAASLTLVRAWIAKGKPKGSRTLGMFEEWSATIGGILDTAGMPGFLENLDEFYELADQEGNAVRAFVATWWEKFGQQDVGVAELFPYVGDLDVGKGEFRSQKTKLGLILLANRDKVFQLSEKLTIRLEYAGKEHRATKWKLQELKKAAE
jgi:hypothetical protein